MDMNEKDERKIGVDELAGYLCGATLMMWRRLVNTAIVLRTMRETCSEPLLDVIIEYVEASKDKASDIQVKAAELFASVREEETNGRNK